ncbi:MAG: HDOD domain-containing protein [Thermodesulfovibrionales bacterium]|nr:HDOD domain-containing protein [Thermodesulfovibrionales bacterium]
MLGRDILDKIKSGYSLPSLSPVAMRLVEIASDDKASVCDIAGMIEMDPALTVRLLRVANSAFFRTIEPITTVEQAVMRIGLNHLRVMALSLSLRDTFPMGKVGPMDYEKFWRSSLYQALLAKALAQHLHTCKPEEAFVAGLVLEIGLLIFFDLFIRGKDIEIILDLHSLDQLLSREKELFGVNHREIGEAALKHWQFPEEIIACQRFYNMDKEQTVPPLAIACEMSRKFFIHLEKSVELETLFREAEEVYGLRHDILSEILVLTFEEVETIAEGLKVDINKEKDLFALMEKANASLSILSEKILICQDIASKQILPSFEAFGEHLKKPGHRDVLQAVAHEIRNPLMAVGCFARRLSESLDPQSKSWEYIQIIIEESRRLETALSIMTTEAP